MTTTDLEPARPATAVLPAGGRRPAHTGGGLATSLAAYSNLDEMMQQMRALDGDLEFALDDLGVLQMAADTLDTTVANVDQLAKLYEASLQVRAALDADSLVASMIADMVGDVTFLAGHIRGLNAQAYLGLGAMVQVQDRSRARGEGPRLHASVGR